MVQIEESVKWSISLFVQVSIKPSFCPADDEQYQDSLGLFLNYNDTLWQVSKVSYLTVECTRTLQFDCGLYYKHVITLQ
jgi:hypothetical protein